MPMTTMFPGIASLFSFSGNIQLMFSEPVLFLPMTCFPYIFQLELIFLEPVVSVCWFLLVTDHMFQSNNSLCFCATSSSTFKCFNISLSPIHSHNLCKIPSHHFQTLHFLLYSFSCSKCLLALHLIKHLPIPSNILLISLSYPPLYFLIKYLSVESSLSALYSSISGTFMRG